MSSYTRALSAEWLKLARSRLWLQILLCIAASTLLGILDGREVGAFRWERTLTTMSILHAMLFLPIMTGVFSAMVCRYEHAGGGWKQLLVLPVSRGAVYLSKFSVVCILLAVIQLLFLGGLLLVGVVNRYAEPIPWGMLLQCLAGGWIACLPLAALQLAVSTAWSSFAAPLALNVVFTIPNMLVANSATYAPYYPWAQPLLAMMPTGGADFGAFNLPFESLMLVVVGGFLLFFMAGLLYFQRKEI
ncbi:MULTISPECIES: ABC transporter permease [Paenibacillus]|uniref:ABC transporter permease subunit n=1 Tax=Paenibacillus campinasensis TaxID=66347 RepID=A0ABW9SZL6_9BACL|nr:MULTISPECIES: ABC transporter permease [Paenibacillus]MUG65375.1 ABC transporter permease subunit [Paenibacillus campinasensis]PAK49558.1 hypothetical protein CHH75_20440 [Paenibacillus sp. 7541]